MCSLIIHYYIGCDESICFFFFRVRIFPHSVRMWENAGQKKFRIQHTAFYDSHLLCTFYVLRNLFLSLSSNFSFQFFLPIRKSLIFLLILLIVRKTRIFTFSRVFVTYKVSKYRVFSGPYSVRMQENTDQKKTPYLDIFHTVVLKF